MTLWSARMGAEPSEVMMAFTSSLESDRRLAPDDVRGSAAHVRGLGRAGILSADEVDALLAALDTVGAELESGTFVFEESDEDVHTAIERRLTEIAGEVGAKVHTGRSRNDQVATALRLHLRRRLVSIGEELAGLVDALVQRAADAGEHYAPGYTHLQRAQSVLVAHQLLAHAWSLLRDLDRLFDAYRRVDVSPLGAGALGGSSLPLDPDGVARDLSFSARFTNSIDAVADRDFVAEVLFVLALAGVHASRLGEEIVLYSSEEFGFYRLDDAWATGSSMLPQKKNPDVAELARGKSGRLIGHLTGLLTTLKGLPLAYNRDLQEDKDPLFDALDQIDRLLPALSGLIGSLSFNFVAMEKAADAPTLVAIDLAEFLVARGVPFREAHGIVGALVRRSLAGEGALSELAAADPRLGEESAELFVPGSSVKRRQSPGGGGIAAVAEQRLEIAAALAAMRSRLDSLAC
ncbi:MAG TPA: argininosuccinate lyase [Acidimicrobiales bacterium]